MKTLIVSNGHLAQEGRWDIDYHLPPELIEEFPRGCHRQVGKCADIIRVVRDPTLKPSETFHYIDISSIDVETGEIASPQELIGEEAPSRARKLVRAYDVIISTCRPTRGAIAVVPEELHGQICSTGFSVIRAKPGVNPYYLHFALRLASTAEQFRKWSTGSSYPAILDEDVEKTVIPVPKPAEQDRIAYRVRTSARERQEVIRRANAAWEETMDHLLRGLKEQKAIGKMGGKQSDDIVYSTAQIAERIRMLPKLDDEKVQRRRRKANGTSEELLDLFGEFEPKEAAE